VTLPRHPLRLLALGGALALAACAEVPRDRYPPPPAHTILVMPRPASLTVPGVGPSGRLDPADRERAAVFLESYRERARGPLSLSVTGLDPAAARRTTEALTRLARRHGVPATAIAATASAAGTPGATLGYTDFVAVPPECGGEVGTIYDPDNAVSLNHGCALQRDLAAMVASPADLVSPRSASPTDGARVARVIDAYRQGQNTSAQHSTGSAAVSSVTGALK